MTATAARPQKPAAPKKPDRAAVRQPGAGDYHPHPRPLNGHPLTFVVNPGRPTPHCAVLHLRGELDMTTAGVADELARDLLGDRPHLIIDLSAVSFLGAAGLHVLVRADDCARSGRGRLYVVTGHHRAVHRVLALTELDRGLTLHPTLAAAAAALASP